MQTIKKNGKILLSFVLGGIVSAVPLSLILIFFEIYSYEAKIKSSKQENLLIAVSSIEKILNTYYEKSEKKELPEELAKLEASKLIEKLRYNEIEYFWIHDLNLKMVMHPIKPDLNNKDISTIKDPTGKHLFQEMNKVVNDKSQGFVEYMWPKPGESHPVPKLSFVKLFKPWGWVLGSGIYIDDMEKEIATSRNKNLFWLFIGAALAILISIVTGFRLLKKYIIPVQEIINKLNDETSNLLNDSANLAESSSRLRTAAESQSASLHETAAAMTEMNEMISKTAHSAEVSASLSNKTQSLSANGLSSLKQVSDSIGHITFLQEKLQTDLDHSLSKINEIQQVMKAISSKTEVINEIVLQTKLLSFNASVEAARAGEAGKGFSVVAEEVGNLAKLSGDSAVEISEIVSTSQSKVNEITMEIKTKLEETINEVKKSVLESKEKSDASLLTLQEVVTISNESSEMAKSISDANKEQSIGSQEATKAIRNIEQINQDLTKIVDTNTEVAQKISALSDRLGDVSQSLSTIVDQ